MTNRYPEECMDAGNPRKAPCRGPLEEYYSDMGTRATRCTVHTAEHYALMDSINQRYPQHAPANFDPAYAGERWDDDY